MIKVHCGQNNEVVEKEKHPIDQFYYAKQLVLKSLYIDEDIVEHSNSPDFISSIKYIAEKHNAPIEFFLNGISTGDDIELIFEDFNKAIDLLDEELID